MPVSRPDSFLLRRCPTFNRMAHTNVFPQRRIARFPSVHFFGNRARLLTHLVGFVFGRIIGRDKRGHGPAILIRHIWNRITDKKSIDVSGHSNRRLGNCRAPERATASARRERLAPVRGICYMRSMVTRTTRKPQKKRVENDPAEYKRFRDMAKVVEASDDPKDFERAFKRVVTPTKRRIT